MNELIRLLTSLVRMESTSGDDAQRAVLGHLAHWLKARDVPLVEIREDNSYPFLIARSRPHVKSSLLILGHADVVPYGNPATWDNSPVSGDVADGRLFGRGASDMKGGLAAAAAAVVQAVCDNIALDLIVTCDEEIGCLGAAATCSVVKRLEPAAVMIPESTLNLVACGHRGATWLKVTTTGRAAHGSTPERGRNAIVASARWLDNLDEAPVRSHPVLGGETINVGVITGGQAPNIVADTCHVELDIRTVGANANHVRTWLESQPDVAAVEETLQLPAVWTEPDHPWVQTLNQQSYPPVVSYFTDGAVVQSALLPGTPVVICGPGDPALVHGPNESVSIDAVHASVDVMLNAARSAA